MEDNSLFNKVSFGGEVKYDIQTFKDYLIPIVQNILNKFFPTDANKKRIKVYSNRLDFACPFCGDSAWDSRKKRGSILLEGTFRNSFKCQNCGIFMPLNVFFSKFGGNALSIDAIDYIVQNKMNSQTFVKGDASTNLIFDFDTIENLAVSRDVFKDTLNLMECDGSVYCYGHTYLKNRYQFSFDKFLYDAKYNRLFILNLTPKGKVFGFQVRNLNKNSNSPKYKSYNISNTRRIIYGELQTELSEKYNSLSMLFDSLTADYTKKIILTEGPLDSFLLPNAIATCGASKHIMFEYDFLYMYDSDETGIKHAIDSIASKKKVFMWNKFLSHVGFPKRNKWDWNDAIIEAKKRGVNLPSIYSFFTDDEFDILDI